jgi:hypothetical protein
MFKKTRQDLVEHYAKMALNPATLDHARLRVKELEKDSTGLWTGIGKEIAVKIKELKEIHE